MHRFTYGMVAGIAASIFLAAPAFAAILNGPYLLDPARRGVTVVWQTDDVNGQVFYGTSPNRLDHVLDILQADNGMLRGKLTCLEPKTMYYYKVKSGTQTSDVYHFLSGGEPADPFSFIAYGDTRTNEDAHAAVAAGIEKEKNISFILQSGDMVEIAFLPAEWADFFKVEFNTTHYAPEAAIMGNHEELGGRPTFEKYFSTPDHYGANASMYAFQYGNTYFINLDISMSYVKNSAQYQWLTQQLETAANNPTVKHCIVQGHFGPFSCSEHANDLDVLSYRNALTPLFEKYGVDLVLSGHDHNYQHSRVNGIDYIISGGGGAPLYSINSPLCSYTVKAESTLDYVRINVSGPVLTVTGKRPNGSLIENFVINHTFGTGGGTAPADPCADDDDDDNDDNDADDDDDADDDSASDLSGSSGKSKSGCGC